MRIIELLLLGGGGGSGNGSLSGTGSLVLLLGVFLSPRIRGLGDHIFPHAGFSRRFNTTFFMYLYRMLQSAIFVKI